jgi:phosphoglycolate phosphatase
MTYPGAVLFDLDGTLIDSAPDIAGALNDLLTEEGRHPYVLAEVRRMVGEGVHRLIEKAFGETGRTDILADRFVELYNPRASLLTQPVEGAFAALDAFRAAGIPMAVCTNKPDESALQVLSDLDLLPYFSVVLGGTCGLPKKPDPAILLEAARRLGVKAAECLMIGDALPDVDAARAAGMPVWLVRSGYGAIPADELEADRIMDDLRELVLEPTAGS